MAGAVEERELVVDGIRVFYRRVAQLWRRRPIGEILNRTTTKSSLALLLRQARGDHRSPMPPEFVDSIWNHWDRGTQHAVLQRPNSKPSKAPATGPG